MAEEDFDLASILGPDESINERRLDVVKTIRENSVSSFPADLSIFSAMDELLQCFALGGQIRNYYRYGSYSLCEKQREKFWFALWNGSVTDSPMDVEKMSANPRELERRVKVQEFYKKQMLKNKMRGLSEDVWDERKEPLELPFKE